MNRRFCRREVALAAPVFGRERGESRRLPQPRPRRPAHQPLSVFASTTHSRRCIYHQLERDEAARSSERSPRLSFLGVDISIGLMDGLEFCTPTNPTGSVLTCE